MVAACLFDAGQHRVKHPVEPVRRYELVPISFVRCTSGAANEDASVYGHLTGPLAALHSVHAGAHRHQGRCQLCAKSTCSMIGKARQQSILRQITFWSPSLPISSNACLSLLGVARGSNRLRGSLKAWRGGPGRRRPEGFLRNGWWRLCWRWRAPAAPSPRGRRC